MKKTWLQESCLKQGFTPVVMIHMKQEFETSRIHSCAQQQKDTLGITGLFGFRVPIDIQVQHLDVGSSRPKAAEGLKGRAVRPLKRYVIWVQNVVRQFGFYPRELRKNQLLKRASTQGQSLSNPW